MKRFFISPDGIRARWMPSHEAEAFHPGWVDVTDWTDEALIDWIGKAIKNRSSGKQQTGDAA